jgi:hypothetical protein
LSPVRLFTAAALAACASPAAAQAQERPTVTLRASGVDIVHGGIARLSGRLSGVTGNVTRRRIEVLADEHPYGRSRFDRRAGTVTIARDGRFSLVVRPVKNTLFRARVAGDHSIRSGRVEVFVAPRASFSVRPGPRTVRLAASFRFSRGARVVSGAFFYQRLSGQPTYRRVAFRRLRLVRPGTLVAVAVIRRPARAAFFGACTRRSPVGGMDRPGVDAACGRLGVPRTTFG